MLPMDGARKQAHVLDRDEVEGVLSGKFYSPSADPDRRPKLIAGGTAAPWTESAFDEGCVRKWLLTGDDFRPSTTARYADSAQ